MVDPPGQTVISCPQTVEDLTDQVEEFACPGRGRLGAPQPPRARPGRPAGAGRRYLLVSGSAGRWARPWWSAPDVLLVDEPTNHLDSDTRRVLVALSPPSGRRDGGLSRPGTARHPLQSGASGRGRRRPTVERRLHDGEARLGGRGRSSNVPSSKRFGPRAGGWNENWPIDGGRSNKSRGCAAARCALPPATTT